MWWGPLIPNVYHSHQIAHIKGMLPLTLMNSCFPLKHSLYILFVCSMNSKVSWADIHSEFVRPRLLNTISALLRFVFSRRLQIVPRADDKALKMISVHMRPQKHQKCCSTHERPVVGGVVLQWTETNACGETLQSTSMLVHMPIFKMFHFWKCPVSVSV